MKRHNMSPVAGVAMGRLITAYASSIGPVVAKTFCPEEIDNNPFHLPDAEAAAMAQKYVDRMMEEKESSLLQESAVVIYRHASDWIFL